MRTGLWPFRWISAPSLALLRRLRGPRPVPFFLVRTLKRAAPGLESLVPDVKQSSGDLVSDPDLRELLRDFDLGMMAIGPEMVDILERTYSEVDPARVIEFGSGVSTVCLAFLARRCGRPRSVVAFDQEAPFAAQTREWLSHAGLSEYAVVVEAPLAPPEQSPSGHSTYLLPTDLHDLLGQERAELVLVDGPFAEPGARVATLPLVRNWIAPGARILLDDALRDGELEVGAEWAASSWLQVHGIHLVDKGVLVASVVHQA